MKCGGEKIPTLFLLHEVGAYAKIKKIMGICALRKKNRTDKENFYA